jgi:ankyrin repeat protein
MVQLLLQRGAKPDAKDIDDMTSLSCASYNGRTEIGQLLLNAGAKTESDNGHSIPSLGLKPSMEEGDAFSWYFHESIERIELFNEDNSDSRSPLSNAAHQGHETLVQLLLDKGAEINAKDINNMTPLALAAEQGHEGVVRILLKKGPKLESRDSGIWRTALAHATAEGHLAIVKMLIESGADTETKDIDGSTPLMVCVIAAM